MKAIWRRKLAVLLCVVMMVNSMGLGSFAFAGPQLKQAIPVMSSGKAGGRTSGEFATDSDSKPATDSNSDSDSDYELENDLEPEEGLILQDEEPATVSDADELLDTISVQETEIDHDFNVNDALEKLGINMVMPLAADGEDFWTILDEASSDVREQMVNRKQTIHTTLRAGSSDLMGELSLIFKVVIDDAVKHTGAGNEGDYLSYQIYYWRADADVYAHRMNMTFYVSYYTTAEQEEMVDDEVEQVLDAIDEIAFTDYEKTKQIYEWVCNNVRYSEEGLHTTAYNALVNGTCACQGYSVLLYRLLNDEGIPCRIISGYGGDEEDFDGSANHCWNAVEMEGEYYSRYYYLDVTWDQAYYDTKSPYYYFLHGYSDWEDHIRTGELPEEVFLASENYPKQKNTITAENITYSIAGYAQSFFLYAAANDEAPLSYQSSGDYITVNSQGEVVIPSGVNETAEITITAAAIHDYEETTAKFIVSTEELSFSLWEKYDGNTGEVQGKIASMDYACGNFTWNKENGTVPANQEQLYLKIAFVGKKSGDVLNAKLTIPEGFSFQKEYVETVCDQVVLQYNGAINQYIAVKEIYPAYRHDYTDGLAFDVAAEILGSSSLPGEHNYSVVPISKCATEGVIELRNSFHDSAVGRDWTYYLDADFDGLAKKSNEYDHQLAKISAALSAATYHNYTIHDVFQNLGFSNIKSCNYSLNDQETANRNQVACAFGLKKYTVPGDNKIYTVVGIAIRGTVGDEWYSNFEIGNGNIHEGFFNAKVYVMDQFLDYMDTLQLDAEHTKLLITGHSRAAATADLVADDLNSNELYQEKIASKDNIYTYTFAAPYSVKKQVERDNIFNVVNYQDLVAHVPGTYRRSGTDKVFNAYCDNGYYGKQKKLKSQFSSMWTEQEYTTWERPNILEACDDISANFLINHYGDALADVMLGKYSIPSHPYLAKIIYAGIIVNLALNPLGTAKLYEKYLYVSERIWNNHAIETYIAWLNTSSDEDALYTDIQKVRILTFKYAGNTKLYSARLLNDTETADFRAGISVYDMNGNLLSRIEHGEVVSADGPYCVVDGDTVILCLDDSEYRIEIAGNDVGTMDVIIKEYNENEENTRLVSYLNVSGDTATLKAGYVPETSDTEYSLLLEDGVRKKADYSVSGDEIGNVTVSVSSVGDGYALGGGNYTKGEAVVLYAIEENDSFSGWYIENKLISTEPVYQFICTDDLDVEARFSEKEYCEIYGHTPVEIDGKEPTCTEVGYTKGSYCSVCGVVIEVQTELAAMGHQIVIDEAVPPTTISTGLTEGEHCSVCGTVIIKQQIIPALPGTNNGGSGSDNGTGGSSGGNSGSGGSSGGGSGSGGSSGSGGGGSGSKGSQVVSSMLKDTYENTTWIQDENGAWRLLKSDHTYVTGWAAKTNRWYYFRMDDQVMQTGWVLLDGIWYYLDPVNGHMITGWVFWNQQWYYLNPGSGAMRVGWVRINEKWYYFYSNGALAVKTTTPDGYYVDENGVWME